MSNLLNEFEIVKNSKDFKSIKQSGYIKIFRYFIFCFLLFITTSALAATYYIDPDVANGGAGTELDPYNNFNEVITPACGDTVYIKRGTVLYDSILVLVEDLTCTNGNEFTIVGDLEGFWVGIDGTDEWGAEIPEDTDGGTSPSDGYWSHSDSTIYFNSSVMQDDPDDADFYIVTPTP